MKLRDVICCSRREWLYQNISPTFKFPLVKTKGLIWLSFAVLCFSEKFLAANFKEILLKRGKKRQAVLYSCWKSSPEPLHYYKKIASLSKPHPPLIIFRTSQFVFPKAVIFKHDFEMLWGFPSYLKGGWQRILKTKLILFSKSGMSAIYHLGDSGGQL